MLSQNKKIYEFRSAFLLLRSSTDILSYDVPNMRMIFLDEDPDYERAIARYKSVPVIITMALMLTTTPIFTGSVLAVKKSSGGAKTSSKTTTTQPHHIKGVNVFRVHTVPSKVAVGSTFNLRGIDCMSIS